MPQPTGRSLGAQAFRAPLGARASDPHSEHIWVRGPPARIQSAYGYAGLQPAFRAQVGTRASDPHSEHIWVRGPPARIQSTGGHAGLRPAFRAQVGTRASDPHSERIWARRSPTCIRSTFGCAGLRPASALEQKEGSPGKAAPGLPVHLLTITSKCERWICSSASCWQGAIRHIMH